MLLNGDFPKRDLTPRLGRVETTLEIALKCFQYSGSHKVAWGIVNHGQNLCAGQVLFRDEQNRGLTQDASILAFAVDSIHIEKKIYDMAINGTLDVMQI